MYEPIRRWTLRFLRVPPEPHAPIGDPASLRVFNAGRNYFRLRMAGWAVGQVLALAGFVFWTALLLNIEAQTRTQKEGRVRPASLPTLPVAPQVETNAPPAAGTARGRSRRHHQQWLDRAAIERIKAASAQAETGTGANAGKKGKFFAGVGWIQTRLRGIGVTSSKRRVSDYLGG